MTENASRIGGVMDAIISRLTSAPPEDTAEREQRDRDHRATACLEGLMKDIGPRHRACRLENFECPRADQRAALKQVAEWVKGMVDHTLSGSGLFLYGPPGTGKDHLAVSGLRAAAALGFACRWANMQLLYGDIAGAVADSRNTERILNAYAKPDILCLSDPFLGVGQTESNYRTLYRLVTDRYDQCKPTWVTLNAHNREQAIKALTEPVYDRLIHGALAVYCNWESYRKPRTRDAA